MQLNVNKPNFDNNFKARIARAIGKGSSLEISSDGDFINIIVNANNRVVGKFTFNKGEEESILIKKFVIEREFYPFEFAISRLVKYLKKKKVKFIVWD